MTIDVGQWIAARAHHADVLTSQGRHAEARQVMVEAVGVAPEIAALHAKLATIEFALAAYEAAVESGRRATEIDPGFAPAYANLSSALGVLGREAEAIAAAERAIGLQPDLVQARVNLGALLERRGEVANAIEQYNAVLLQRPAYPTALFNRGRAYSDLGYLDEAANDYQAAILLQPDFAEAHVNLGMLYLLRGDFKRGWPEYAWTMRLPSVRSAYRFFDKHQLWDGESLEGKRLLITREQGLGDFMQMARFFPEIAALGGELHVECPPECAAIVSGMPAVFHESDGMSITEGAFDYYLPIMNLPRVLGIDAATMHVDVPYVRPVPAQTAAWTKRLVRDERLRVGLVWAGNPQNSNDRNRSMPVAAFRPLRELKGVAWFGLQKAFHENDTTSHPLEIVQLGEDLDDFSVTAAIVASLDLVISVDTSVAHLVGAMNRPVWLLLPYRPDWRWLLDRPDTPWYPSMRLFRQPVPGGWASVIDEVVQALGERMQPR